MRNDELIIALDTSNYTTSVAIVDSEGGILANFRKLLTVKSGERGLRQSDAVFLHTVNIPELMKKAREVIGSRKIVAVGVSERPRNVDGSYMPCFLVGVAAAESIAAALGVPLYRFSHQCGHVMAAAHTSGDTSILDAPFAAFHVSGGTTELLRVSYNGDGFRSELLGGTSDLNAGQIIDRIGVYMGLSFPAGREMERLALTYEGKIPGRKISLSGMRANLSGLENMACKMYDETKDASLVSAFVLNYLGRVMIGLSEAYEASYGATRFLYAGGVMCNSLIRRMLSEKFDALFATPETSSDNAVGIAVLTLRSFCKGER